MAKKKARILFVCSEATPLAKTGGMADVCGALPAYLGQAGYDVDVVLPYYKSTKRLGVVVEPTVESMEIPIGGRAMAGAVLDAKTGLPWRARLIDQPDYFSRDGLYTDPVTGRDYPDNAERYAFFAKAVVEMIRRTKVKYDIVHAHDWQAALVVAYLRKLAGADPGVGDPGTLFTMHNLGYQGKFDANQGRYFDLPPEAFTPAEMEYYGQWSLLKGGIIYADYVSTVSENYAKEIQTRELGFGFHDILAARADRLVGITHGVDESMWNPATDQFLAANYSLDKMNGKEACKKDLLNEFGISADWIKKPVLGFVGRLVEQKGLDLVTPIAEDVIAHGYILLILGTGDKKYEAAMLDLAARFPEAAAVRIGFDEKLAHKIVAGADMQLVPSIYEPCGLNQMYAQKYGTIPIVRATGGLDDTVTGWSKGKRNADGFKFSEPHPEALLKALADAADLFDDKKRWAKLVENAMQTDHSWEKAARKYANVYAKIIKLKKEPLAPAAQQ